MRVTVLGTGYVGLVHAVCLAQLGHEVLGVDIDRERVAALSRGRSPIYEPGLQELLSETTRSHSLRFGTDPAEAADSGQVHFVCVGTPQRPGSFATDVRGVEAVVDDLARRAAPGALIVGKSTVPVGTALRLDGRLKDMGSQAEIAWNPEFLREGFAVPDSLHPERIVVGVSSARAELTLREVYAPMLRAGVPLFVTDPSTAELVKMASNAFLATKISFINAMSEVCDATGADVMSLAAAMGADTRIGARFLEPGLGYGGSCFPKDLRGFVARAEELGLGAAAFLRQVDAINARQRARVVDVARRLAGGSLEGRKVAVLGAAFKPGSDDVRDSPALEVAASVQRQGASVWIHDPRALDNARSVAPSLLYALDVPKACEDADLVLHLTAWPEYRAIDPRDLATVVRSPRVLDARNTLDTAQWEAAGWEMALLGRSSSGRS
jgi:UDPglucose 6-dehydrogenase